MPELKVRCPYCKRTTGTGILFISVARAHASKKFVPENYPRKSTQCKKCGQSVTWDGKDIVNKDEFG